jgi:hypothetical protein
MKYAYYLIALMCSTTFGCNFEGASQNQSISIKNTDAGYQFEASFPEGKTEKVVNYLEEKLQADELFLAASDVKDSEVNLGDSIKFYLKSSPGKLEIEFKKQNNSEAAYHKLVSLCNGIKEVLK